MRALSGVAFTGTYRGRGFDEIRTALMEISEALRISASSSARQFR